MLWVLGGAGEGRWLQEQKGKLRERRRKKQGIKIKLVKGTCDVALGVSAGGQLGASTCPHARSLWPKLPTP